MKARETIIAMGLLICTAFAYLAFAYPTVYPTGTTIYKPEKCWNSYTLVPYEQGLILLIDMNGNVVHK